MSRVTRWKLEKTKVKVVFRLQFHATHIPQTGWDKLFISFIPADSAKATAKTTKANVRSGTCKWGDPIYETTRLLHDIKTKQYDDKFYKLLVAMGSSRSSVLGEANINLAHYADASKPSSVALPLQGCDSGTILHVTVQLLTSKTGFREFELQRELRERGLPDESVARKISSVEDTINDQTDKVNSKARFKEELPPLEEEVGLSEEYADSAVGFDGSSSTSESLYADKHDTSSTHEVDSLKSTIPGDIVGPSQSLQPEKGDPSNVQFLPPGSNDWAHGWGADYSADNDLANAYEENSRLRRSLEIAESSILELKLEVSSLQSHADEIGIEAQKFSQLLATEMASGEQLAKEIYVLRSECSSFKADLGQLKNSKLYTPFTVRETKKTDQDASFQELPLRWVKGLLELEDKLKDVRSKACFGFQEREVGSFSADIEALLGVVEGLKQGTRQTISTLNLANVKDIREMNLHKGQQQLPGSRFSAEFYQPEGLLHCVDVPALVSQEADSADANSAIKGKMFELIKELGESKAEREGLARKMDQMECYYEALVQELEETQRQMMGELQNIRNEHTTCLYTLSATKAEMENIQQDMDKKITRFTEEKCDLETLNKDLERRAVTAEASLKRARLNYSIAVNQLQKDLELLSFQVLSMYETNDNLIKQAFSDSSTPSVLEPKSIENKKLDSKELQSTKLSQSLHQFDAVKKQDLDGDIISDLRRSLLLQKDLYRKVEEEVGEAHLVNAYLDIFSKTLQETLLEASADYRLLKKKADKLTQQLEVSTESKGMLRQRLQSVMDEVQHLNEYKNTCDAKCNDMALQNQILETNFQKVTEENVFLSQKIIECERLLKDLESYENKFQACSIEKLELENLLKMEGLENENLKNKIFSLQDELKAVKTELDELASAKEEMKAVRTELDKLASASSLEKLELENLLKKEVLENENLRDEVSSLQGEMKAVRTELDKLASAKIGEENFLLSEKIAECETLTKDLGSCESKFQACSFKKLELENLLEKEALENANLQHKISSMQDEVKTVTTDFEELSFAKEDLQSTVNFLHDKLRNLLAFYDEKYNGLNVFSECVCQGLEPKDLKGTVMRLEELQHIACKKIFLLIEEKQDLVRERDVAQMSLNAAKSDIIVMKRKFEDDAQNVMGKLEVSSIMMCKLQSEVEAIANRLKLSSEAEENYEQHHRELLSAFDDLEAELQHLTSKNKDLAQEIMALQSVSEELGRYKQEIAAVSEERKVQLVTLKDKNEESAKLELELNNMRSNLQSLHDELHAERSIRSKFDSRVTDLTSQLNEKDQELLTFDQQKAELVHLKQSVKDLELEKASIFRTLSDSKQSLKAAGEHFSNISCLEAQFSEMHELSIATDVRLTFTKSQYESCFEELQNKYVSVESMLNHCLSTKAHYIEENTKLMTSLESLRSELDASTAQNRMLLDTNSNIRIEFDELKKRAEDAEDDSRKHALEIERLGGMLVKSDEEIDDLIFIKEELEVKLLVLKLKLDEQQPQMALVEEYKHELRILQNKYNEISQKLSEQVLKTEEFKNLSVHLKELKDKADAECLQAREKREPEGPPLAVQESLRIAFIKEQYETKLQEMKQQLSISKKHSEEMLWKLQDAINDVEDRKKSEASHLKRNEELGMRILELETDLHSALSEKREIMRAYDLTKAEKECSLISLECCKEEKKELEATLRKCSEEKSKISVELTSMKEFLQSSAFQVNNQSRDSEGLRKADCVSDELVNVILPEKIPVSSSSTESLANISDQNISNDCQEVGPAFFTPTIDEDDHSKAVINLQKKQDALTSRSVGQEDVLQKDTEHLAVMNDHFKTQSLKSSMEHLNKELEKMKRENLLLSQDDDQFDPNSTGLQRELMQLQKVNEELGTKFPLFNEFSCNGNALERVLALEIELAESLQAKKSRVQFQSSFLKQHGDEEAVFKSFRDINELIKDMLEIKRRYVTVETELKDMHDRYSQLSLQFAEVEGERQKLMMTLKNVRASKKVPYLNRSSTAPLGGPFT
ncbi:COP1-interactive protein 1 isoform X2 [Humulus lupulus]|uniref:COP1-interactive protein 1 isoform X2 n=1 Tax=Humulus lupulus TaxID=3486 RepID=UPI002B40B8E9|nr:COP1-interactive protein 1 isoform X2 [Humulus lupulus]